MSVDERPRDPMESTDVTVTNTAGNPPSSVATGAVPLRSHFPTDGALLAGLAGAVSPDTRRVSRLVSRRRNEYRSTFPSEHVVLGMDDGSEIRVFVKYVIAGRSGSFGHRPGSDHEARVYESVLAPMGVGPQLIGTVRSQHGSVWILLEDLAGAFRLEECEPHDAFTVAGWAGRFHRRAESRTDSVLSRVLFRYDEAYYTGWARRAWSAAARWSGRVEWLAEVCDAFGRVSQELMSAPETIIHGEFTTSNVMIAPRGVVPTDWESAAVAAGEIDIAALFDGWPREARERGDRAYRDARWPDGSPPNHDRSLLAARLYWNLRWLSKLDPDRSYESYEWRYEQVREAAADLGLTGASR